MSWNPDQLYKIVNVKYSDQAVDLLDGKPTAPIAGFHVNHASRNQSWYIRPGPDSTVVFVNGTSTDSYAFTASQLVGSPLLGNQEPSYWIIIPFEAGQYRISTQDGGAVWTLPGGNDRTQIVLGAYGDDSTMWTIYPDN